MSETPAGPPPHATPPVIFPALVPEPSREPEVPVVDGAPKAEARAVFDPQMFPSRRRPMWQFILDHNPCLLLSTVLMLLGCYLINGSINLHAGDQMRLVGLIGVVNLYELCIIALGLVLIRRSRGTARDGWWLLLFESLFLVNSTFLNVDPELLGGWWLNVGMLALAIAKAAVLMRGLRLGLGVRTFGSLAVQLVFIYCLPIILWFASIDGVMPAHRMYALWWVVGLLPVAYDLLARTSRQPALDLVQTVIRRTYLVAPWLMLLIHLRFSHWAHHCDFNVAYLAPVLLGLAIASRRVAMPLPMVRLARLLPVAALLLTLAATREMELPVTWLSTVEYVRPGVLVCMGVLLTYSYLASLWAATWMAGFLSLATGAYLVQSEIYTGLYFAARQTARTVESGLDILPKTAGGWGVASVVAAFALLGLGALAGLRRHGGAGEAHKPAGGS